MGHGLPFAGARGGASGAVEGRKVQPDPPVTHNHIRPSLLFLKLLLCSPAIMPPSYIIHRKLTAWATSPNFLQLELVRLDLSAELELWVWR